MNFKDVLKETYFGTLARKYVHRKRNSSRIGALKAIEEFYHEPLTPEEKEAMVNDMITCAKKRLISADEYFLYDFPSRTEEERDKFASNVERIFICEKFNKAKNRIIFENKYETYKRFKKYYKRDVLAVFDSEHALQELEAFTKKHDKFIVKPIDSSEGKGIEIVDIKNFKDIRTMYETMLKSRPSGYIVEELINQSIEMAEFHPHSVNTVRMYTIRLDDRIEYYRPFIRFGQGGSNVDNAGSGGISGRIDPETGIIFKTGDKKGKSFDVHPDSGKQIVGFKVPRWEEAKQLAAELANVVPTNRYTGWDLALTDDGWKLIEGNEHGDFCVFQMIDQKGCRDEIFGFLKELNRI